MRVLKVLIGMFLALVALSFLVICFMGLIAFATGPFQGAPGAPIWFNALFFGFSLWGSVALIRRGAGPGTAKVLKVIFGVLLGMLALTMTLLFVGLLSEGPPRAYVSTAGDKVAKSIWIAGFVLYWFAVIVGCVFLFVSSRAKASQR